MAGESILIRGGTASEATINNRVLLFKELAIETDTYRMKLGDGVTKYNDLVYLPYSLLTIQAITRFNQASINALSWKNSVAFNITQVDIDNWNAGGGGGGSTTVDITATENILQYQLVTSNGKVADSNNIALKNKIIGIATVAIANTFSGAVLLLGEITNLTWSFITGDKLYLNGTTISTIAPSTGFSVSIGTAKNNNTIVVNIRESILL